MFYLEKWPSDLRNLLRNFHFSHNLFIYPPKYNPALRDAPLRCAPHYYIVCEMSICNFLRNVNIDILYQNFYLWPKFRFVATISIMNRKFDFSSKVRVFFKSKFWRFQDIIKIRVLEKNSSFDTISNFDKISSFDKNSSFNQNLEPFWPKFRRLLTNI